jgi:hypothetical protein
MKTGHLLNTWTTNKVLKKELVSVFIFKNLIALDIKV